MPAIPAPETNTVCRDITLEYARGEALNSMALKATAFVRNAECSIFNDVLISVER